MHDAADRPEADPALAAVVPGAVDTHFHIFSDQYASVTGRPRAAASVPDYLAFRARLGIARSVIIAPSTYGTDNTCLFEALQALGSQDHRAVVILGDSADPAALRDWHAQGVRGIRLYAGHGDLDDAQRLQQVARLAADRGWHLQFVGVQDGEPFARWAERLAALPCTLVFDHFGFAPQPGAERSATADALRRLVDTGKAYVKLSGMYIQSRTGAPDYTDHDALAIDLVRRAPERVLWGSDWPHTLAPARPDGADLLRKLQVWAPSPELRALILRDNPERLYWSS